MWKSMWKSIESHSLQSNENMSNFCSKKRQKKGHTQEYKSVKYRGGGGKFVVKNAIKMPICSKNVVKNSDFFGTFFGFFLLNNDKWRCQLDFENAIFGHFWLVVEFVVKKLLQAFSIM